MFVGHTAAALAAKTYEPRASLGLYVVAAYALDFIWPVLLLLGLEQVRIVPGTTAFSPLAFDSYPWSHSLVMAAVWGLCAALLAALFHAPRRVQVVLCLLVISHWVLDFVSHRPDMPLWPGRSPLLGLGLWNSVLATLVVEGVLFAAAVWLYSVRSRALDWIGGIGFWLFVITQALMWSTQPWSPPPPSARFLAWFGFAAWLFPLWAWWVDAHRVTARATERVGER